MLDDDMTSIGQAPEIAGSTALYKLYLGNEPTTYSKGKLKTGIIVDGNHSKNSTFCLWEGGGDVTITSFVLLRELTSKCS